jgi:hypothetical protein
MRAEDRARNPEAYSGRIGELTAAFSEVEGVTVDIVTSPPVNVALAMGVDSMIHPVMRVRHLRDDGLGALESSSRARAQVMGPVLAATLLFMCRIRDLRVVGVPTHPPFRIRGDLGHNDGCNHGARNAPARCRGLEEKTGRGVSDGLNVSYRFLLRPGERPARSAPRLARHELADLYIEKQ